VYGESDDVGITDDERDVLEASPHVSIVRISDAGHFALNQQPGEIAKLVLGAVTSRAPRQQERDARRSSAKGRAIDRPPLYEGGTRSRDARSVRNAGPLATGIGQRVWLSCGKGL
jgi:hypothetical protein